MLAEHRETLQVTPVVLQLLCVVPPMQDKRIWAQNPLLICTTGLLNSSGPRSETFSKTGFMAEMGL